MPARSLCLALTLAITACKPAPPIPVLGEEVSALDLFWTNLSSHCGNSYAGRLVSEDERDADMADAAMVMHVRDCENMRVAIPFHVEDKSAPGGWDRSRAWVLTRSEGGGITLKHEHRHEDGSLDAVTNYGGTTQDMGSGNAQDFPVDDESIAMFEREGLDASLTNVWRIEVIPAGGENPYFAYQLTRRNDPTRLFRVKFDASETVDTPPEVWGRSTER